MRRSCDDKSGELVIVVQHGQVLFLQAKYFGANFVCVKLRLACKELGDICSTRGFTSCLNLCLRCQSIAWLAPPCGSWVWLSRSTTGRSAETPLGNEQWVNRCLHIRVGICVGKSICMCAPLWSEGPDVLLGLDVVQ